MSTQNKQQGFTAADMADQYATAFERGRESVLAERAAEVQLLRADAARLDWLADLDNIIGNVQLPTMCVMNNLHDMRAAIDEAMTLDPEVWAEVADADAGEAFGQEASDAR